MYRKMYATLVIAGPIIALVIILVSTRLTKADSEEECKAVAGDMTKGIVMMRDQGVAEATAQKMVHDVAIKQNDEEDAEYFNSVVHFIYANPKLNLAAASKAIYKGCIDS
jgi:hypothetical protein